MSFAERERPAWYAQVTKYQWIVLLIASLGWIFDVFEGQVFVASMSEMIPSLLPEDAPEGSDSYYNNLAFGSFLLGGALGGVIFGMLSDRIGRTRAMVYSILMYACFTGLTALAQSPWQVIVLRFFVALGVGGEWAVASAMVAEVMPKAARARLLGVFHASSVFGTYLGIAVGLFIVGNPDLKTDSIPDLNWRLAFLVGALPAFLTVWIRTRLREPEQWVQARGAAQTDVTQKTGQIAELFKPGLVGHTLIGVTLAAVGLATFWGVHIYGKNLMRATRERPYAAALPEYLTDDNGLKPRTIVLEGDIDAILKRIPGEGDEQTKLAQLKQVLLEVKPDEVELPTRGTDRDAVSKILSAHFESIKSIEMLGMFLVTTGGGLGLLLFGPICERIGRRGAFLFYHAGGLVMALVMFQGIPRADPATYYWTLPLFGFLTLGMHAGYAIYFPELFPTRLRGTGGGFCFNVGRILAAPVLFISGWMQSGLDVDLWGISLQTTPMSLERSASILALLYLLGVVALLFAPETKGEDLPE